MLDGVSEAFVTMFPQTSFEREAALSGHDIPITRTMRILTDLKISCVLNSTNILLVGEDSVTLTVNMSNLIREHFVKMVDSSFRIAMLIKEIHSGSTSTSPR